MYLPPLHQIKSTYRFEFVKNAKSWMVFIGIIFQACVLQKTLKNDMT